LAPASGFQSVQFRKIELMCTSLENLVPPHLKPKLSNAKSRTEIFDLLYWQEAGLDRKTGKKARILLDFEAKYLDELLRHSERMDALNLNVRLQSFLNQCTEEEKTPMLAALKSFDAAFNIRWPMVHLETARTYLLAKGERKAATGGSQWEKYLHPAFQKRIFFPSLYTAEELDNWGKED
jgi:tryptophan 2,3-dioxygenase